MTCEQCKWFHPQPHKVGDRPCDGWCRRHPQWIHKNKATLGCGDGSTGKPKPRKTKSLEQKWTPGFKAYMEAHPRYFDPDGAWKVWDDLELEALADHIIKQVKKYAASVQGREAKYIKSNKNWLRDGGWKSNYDDIKSNSKACIDCGAPFVQGSHKYAHVDGHLDKTKYRCTECRA